MSLTKTSQVTTKEEREKWVNNIKINLQLNNFGLPPSASYQYTSLEDALKFRAIRELFVRLNLYIATGEASSGSIDYPEAHRRIDYQFNQKSTKNNTVNLKALKKNYFIDVKS